ncbi:hypothetical protein ABBQ38_007575 [Trebouxia sp. C0009 RCD-2024]
MQERREIEAALHDGDLWAVAATNALELGVDVGSLDVTLHLGFPGSVASLWQQAGRAGRREQPSTSIYIAFDGPLDQFFMKQPHKLFGRPIECAQVDANNPQLLEQHVCCACAEMPVTQEEDGCYFGPGLSVAMDSLVAQGLVSRHPHTTNVRALFYSGAQDVPAAAISLRAIDPERYAIVNEEDGDVIEEIEESKAFYEVYDGAVYMFQGRTYLCKKLDLGSKVAMVRAADLKYYTKTRDFTDVHVVGGRSAYPARVGNEQYPSTTACCDAAIVTVRWLGFHRIWQGSGEVFDSIDLFLPDVQFGTQAAYIRVPRAARQRVKDAGLPFRDGLHAASHALLNVVPLYMMCNATDMAAECDNPYDTRFRPERLLLYDKHPGGIGIAAQATPLFSVLLEKALQLIENCDCKPASGCPGCVQHTDCGEYNAVLNKFSAIIVLQCTLEAEAQHRERLHLQQQMQVVAIAVPLVSSTLLSRNIQTDVKNWYQYLRQPSWKPPRWVFGVVWPILYTLMGTASWLVWHNGGWQRHSAALTMYAIQLALNLSWPPLFFSGHKLGMALADSTALLLSVAATTQLFWDAEPAAGKLLLPYLAWTAYATVLNGWIWNKNPKLNLRMAVFWLSHAS